ncbi:MAG TPA: sigma factor-like helix-turn-helix DNA-binding protein [Acidimicrobiales bacterium]|jgi:DNA-directed RNA polymerase sigma subunit (sigma70/sigma32)|nr:sigma factor-like helix-turn-helix DNA-binding protein [Acidimicrobiales bacterium]
MAHYLWPGDSGWPTPESEVAAEGDLSDPDSEVDLDAVCLHAAQAHLLDDLSPLERTVVRARYRLDGAPERSMKELHSDLGLTRHQVRDALESGLAKLRAHLAA